MGGPKIVAVAGATGNQGGAVVQALLRLGGFEIRALTRDPASAKAQQLVNQGGGAVEAVQAEFDDPSSLYRAFDGAHAVFAVTDFWVACNLDPQREIQQGRNLVDAAKKAGVKHFVWSALEDTRPAMKALGVPPVTGDMTVPHFDGKAEIEAYARKELGDTVLSAVLPSIFYENLLPGAGMAPQKQPDGTEVLALPAGQTKCAWCSTADIGNIAAQVIAEGPEKWGGKTAPVAGDHLTVAELATAMSEVLGKQVVGVTPPADDWVRMCVSTGVPEPAAKDLGNMFLFYDKVGMLAIRPVEESKAIYPGIQDTRSWLESNKPKFSS